MLAACGGSSVVYSPPDPNPPQSMTPKNASWGGGAPAPAPGAVTPEPGPGGEATGPAAGAPAAPATGEVSFFVTSVGNGTKGGNFGGVGGADAFCANLASQAGIGGKTWVAYVSTGSENARDRIGTGPWYNIRGQLVAASVDALHQQGLQKSVVLDEKGGIIDMKNAHDVITGSKEDGTFSGENCNGYTSNATTHKASVGHADGGGVGQERAESWNSAHVSHGCDAVQLQRTASQAHLYCFAP